MKPKVKFCGMTRADDIVAARSLGSDYLGFIFVPSSPRSVTLEQAIALRPHVGSTALVGVFDNLAPEEINRYTDELQLDFVQLHGKPDLELVKAMKHPVIQAFRGVPDTATAEAFLQCCAYILVDKAEGEDAVDFDAVAALPSATREKLFLAGGLTPENVRRAADLVCPYALDCARGIETSPGVKDASRMSAFFLALS